ncbi:hypothetical protein BC828DRAFT_440393 [Blastocladiella britannica]|nr:hypothetical protein BC828DRAFT_440393 [Blastocladiella britannica]
MELAYSPRQKKKRKKKRPTYQVDHRNRHYQPSERQMSAGGAGDPGSAARNGPSALADRTVAYTGRQKETGSKFFLCGKTADLGRVEVGRHRDRKEALTAKVTHLLGNFNTHDAYNIRITTVDEVEYFTFEIPKEGFTWNHMNGLQTFYAAFISKKISNSALVQALRSEKDGVVEVAQRRTVTRHGLGTFDFAIVLTRDADTARFFTEDARSMTILGNTVLFSSGTSINDAVDRIICRTATLHTTPRHTTDMQLQALQNEDMDAVKVVISGPGLAQLRRANVVFRTEDLKNKYLEKRDGLPVIWKFPGSRANMFLSHLDENLCYRCGSANHWIAACTATGKFVNGTIVRARAAPAAATSAGRANGAQQQQQPQRRLVVGSVAWNALHKAPSPRARPTASASISSSAPAAGSSPTGASGMAPQMHFTDLDALKEVYEDLSSVVDKYATELVQHINSGMARAAAHTRKKTFGLMSMVASLEANETALVAKAAVPTSTLTAPEMSTDTNSTAQPQIQSQPQREPQRQAMSTTTATTSPTATSTATPARRINRTAHAAGRNKRLCLDGSAAMGSDSDNDSHSDSDVVDEMIIDDRHSSSGTLCGGSGSGDSSADAGSINLARQC